MKIGIMARELLSVNIESGISFFLKPPRGGSPPRDRSDKENINVVVGFAFIFLKVDKLFRLFASQIQKVRTFFNM